jgi:predicted acetyltransferase
MDNYVSSCIETEEEYEEYKQLMRTVFGENDSVDVMVTRILENNPNFSWKNILSVKHGGRIVATLNIIPQTWSIDGIPLKAAEMGMVATLPEYRKQGLQRILNKAYDKKVEEDKFDLSVIEGIPYFYRQFGYEYTIPLDVETKLAVNKIPDYNHRFKIRRLKDEDLPTTAKLLQESQSKYLVHTVRSEDTWLAQHRTGWQADWPFEGYMVEDEDVAVGYFRLSGRGSELFLVEVSEVDQLVAESILGFLKSYAVGKGLTELVSRVSHDEPFSKVLKSIGGEENKPYAWQVKVIDHFRLFQKLVPLLERRLASSHYRRLTDKVKINLQRRCVVLDVVDGKIKEIYSCEGFRKDEVRINYEVFPQLLLGSKSIDELCGFYQDVSVTPRYRELVNVLFPKGSSFIHPCY